MLFRSEPDLYLDGTSSLLDGPELKDLDRMRALFKTFEEKGRLVKILNACLGRDGVRITIGHENLDPDLRQVAVVTASVPLEPEAAWGLGVMGSTRMEYARMISLVEHVALALNHALQELRS